MNADQRGLKLNALSAFIGVYLRPKIVFQQIAQRAAAQSQGLSRDSQMLKPLPANGHAQHQRAHPLGGIDRTEIGVTDHARRVEVA